MENGTGHLINIGSRLRIAQVFSCTCMTKTPISSFHKDHCTYRVLDECANLVDIILSDDTQNKNRISANHLKDAVLKMVAMTPQGFAASTDDDQIRYIHQLLSEIQKLCGSMGIDVGSASETFEVLPATLKAMPFPEQILSCLARMANAAAKIDTANISLEEFAQCCRDVYACTINGFVTLAKRRHDAHNLVLTQNGEKSL